MGSRTDELAVIKTIRASGRTGQRIPQSAHLIVTAHKRAGQVPHLRLEFGHAAVFRPGFQLAGIQAEFASAGDKVTQLLA